MTGRLDVLEFLKESSQRMDALARRTSLPEPLAAEMRRIARELGAEAAGIEAELRAQATLTTARHPRPR